MIKHDELRAQGYAGRRKLAILVARQSIQLAGNRTLKIYGTLSCNAGKRMKITNRVFFISEQEAIAGGYRPCGHCMHSKYLLWKHTLT